MGSSESIPVKIKVGEKEEIQIKGYRPHLGRSIAAVFAIVLSFGLLLILLVWRKDIKLTFFYKECSLNLAIKVLIKVTQKWIILLKIIIQFWWTILAICLNCHCWMQDSFNQLYEEDVLDVKHGPLALPYTKYFFNKKVKYIWDADMLQFVKFKLVTLFYLSTVTLHVHTFFRSFQRFLHLFKPVNIENR